MSKSLHDNIDVIESGYEFLLAYAAQGRESDDGPGGSEVRTTLTGMSEAAANIAADLGSDELKFARVVVDDAGKAGACWIFGKGVLIISSVASCHNQLINFP